LEIISEIKGSEVGIEFVKDEIEIEYESGNMFQEFSEEGVLESVRNLYQSFKKFNSINLENKSMNYTTAERQVYCHNSFLKSKLLLSLYDGA